MKPLLTHRADECRAYAIGMAGMAIAAVLCAGAVAWSLGPGAGLLCCLIVAAVSAAGARHEWQEAKRYSRQ